MPLFLFQFLSIKNTSEQRFLFLISSSLIYYLTQGFKAKAWKISCGFGKCWYFIISLFLVYWFTIFLQVLWNTLSGWWQIARVNRIEKLSQVNHRLEITTYIQDMAVNIYMPRHHTHTSFFFFCYWIVQLHSYYIIVT